MNQLTRAEDKQLKQQLSAPFSRQEAILAIVPDVIIVEVDNHKIYTWTNQPGLAFFDDDVIGKEAASCFAGKETACAGIRLPPEEKWYRKIEHPVKCEICYQ